MNNIADQFAVAVLAIKSDEDLRNCFIHILKYGTSTQQVRVSAMMCEVQRIGAPRVVTDFIRFLDNDKIAHAVLKEIEK